MESLRESEGRREDILRATHEDSRVQQVNRWLDDAPAQRHRQRQQQLSHEERRERELEELSLATKQRARMAQQESKLADELMRKKKEDRADAARIELIVQNDPRLRDLDRQLKQLYVTKERTNQLHQKSASDYARKKQDQEMDRAMLETAKEGEKRKEREAVERRQFIERSKAELLRQMEEKRILHEQMAAEEQEKDKSDVDNLIATIMREEQIEYDIRLKKQEETRSMFNQYAQANVVEKQRKKREEEEMDRKIQEHYEALYSREAAVASKKKEEADRQERIYMEILRQQEEVRKREAELLDIRETLALEEVEQRELDKAQSRRIQLEQMKRDMIAANEEQRLHKQENQMQEAMEEMELRKRMYAKYEEDLEREKHLAARRLQDQYAHKAGIDRQREERIEMHQRAQQVEREIAVRQEQEDAFRERVIQEATRRLLEEHKSVIDEFGPGLRNFKYK